MALMHSPIKCSPTLAVAREWERVCPRKLGIRNSEILLLAAQVIVVKIIVSIFAAHIISQPKVAQKAGVSVRTVRKWEHGHACPTEDHWQALTGILCLNSIFPKD